MMDEITLGQIVNSRAGRDRKRYFIVVSIIDHEYVLLADGDLRKIGNPKKKKVKHLNANYGLSLEIKNKLEEGRKVLDTDLQKCLQSMNLL